MSGSSATLANILGCWWLISWTTKKRKGEAASGEVTGHTWDEDWRSTTIRCRAGGCGCSTSLWCSVWSIWCCIPGLGYFRGVLGWTQERNTPRKCRRPTNVTEPLFATVRATAESPNWPEIRRHQDRSALFVNYCAPCHGSDARRRPRFSQSADNDWLYGGDPETIETTILNGRKGVMPAWDGAQGTQASTKSPPMCSVSSGRECGYAASRRLARPIPDLLRALVMARTAKATGPRRTESDRQHLAVRRPPGVDQDHIGNGRNGQMPAHRDFLGEDKVHLLADLRLQSVARATGAASTLIECTRYISAERRTIQILPPEQSARMTRATVLFTHESSQENLSARGARHLRRLRVLGVVCCWALLRGALADTGTVSRRCCSICRPASSISSG